MIRGVLMLGFWAVLLPFTAVICFPWTLLTGDIRFLYRVGMWGAFTGARIAGAHVHTSGLEKLTLPAPDIFMSNHVSNLDPPIMLPLIPRRTSVMAKKELFGYPLLGKIMRMGSLVPVDRKNRDAGISAVRAAAQVIRDGINMTIYIEGGLFFRRQADRIQKGSILFGGRMPGTSCDDHFRHRRSDAQRKICCQAEPGRCTFS